MPPLSVLCGEEVRWDDERNRFLAVALTLLESETCGSCGTPGWIGHSTDNTIAFKVKSSVCYGCAELEKDREDQEKQNRRKTRGEVRYVEAYNVFGDALPSRFESYVREQQED